jgi:chromosome segregation ATPase
MHWFERLRLALSSAGWGNGSPHARTAALEAHLGDAARALETNRAELRVLVARADQVESEKRSMEQNCQDLERDVDVALEEQREDLARFALVRLLERQRTLERIAARLAQIQEERESLQTSIVEQQTALADLQARARSFMELRTPDGIDRPETIEDEQVELELLKRKRRRAAQAAASEQGET